MALNSNDVSIRDKTQMIQMWCMVNTQINLTMFTKHLHQICTT